jgi:hypothetical protein
MGADLDLCVQDKYMSIQAYRNHSKEVNKCCCMVFIDGNSLPTKNKTILIYTETKLEASDFIANRLL